MLDVRLTAYVTPIAEQPMDSITPVVRVQNFADEDAIVTGLVRIYRDSTGLLEYTSELAVTSLPHGTTADIAALTPFDPGAVADDDYFIICDIHARSSVPPDWHDQNNHLGPFYFDIKSGPMGPAPASHHTTHEQGGIDEVDVSGLSGELADLQPPKNHATSHEAGEADELDVTGLSGLLGDPQTPTAHDVVDHDHAKLYAVDECLGLNQVNHAPWLTGAVNAGVLSAIAGASNHPGVVRFTSSTSANSGVYILAGTSSFILAGYERADCYFRPQTLSGTTIRFGFHDSASVTAPTDGAYIYMDPATGKLTGRTMNNTAGSTTGTDYQLVTNTWYKARVQVNADATRIDFYLWSEAGALLWTDNLTTNIPTTTGRETGHGVAATNSGTTAVALVDVDMFDLEIDRVLIR